MFRQNHRMASLVGVIVVTLAYSIVHGLLRYAATATLGGEDSLSLVYAQEWALGYTSDKPPLYIWMLAAVQTLTGANIIAILVLKYGLLTATTIFTYLAASRVLHNPLWATLTAFSLSLCFEIGWAMHEGVTYTVALTTMIMATTWSFLKLRDKGGTRTDYLLFGFFCALGLLSNYNFIIFLGALTFSGFSLRSFRNRFQSPRIFLSIGITLALIAPFCFWLIAENPAGSESRIFDSRAQPSVQPDQMPNDSASPQIAKATDRVVRVHRSLGELGGRFGQLLEKGYLRRSFTALINSVEGPTLFLFPLIPLLPLLFPGLASNLINAGWTFGKSGLENDSERLLLRMTVAALALLLLAVLVGFDRGGSQYMHPLFLPTVLLVLALAKHQTRSSRQIRAYLLILFLVFVGMVGLRAFGLFVGSPMCGSCEMWENFEPLAEALQVAGKGDASILTSDRMIAGNLRQLLPMAHVAIAERRRLIPHYIKKNDAIDRVTVITRPDAGGLKNVINLLCDAHDTTAYAPPPSRSFVVMADWRAKPWGPAWHLKSVWYVSAYKVGEVCSPTEPPKNW